MARKLTNNGPALTTGGIVLGGAGGGGLKGLPKTAQTTCYHVGDDGDIEPGITQSFTPMTTGQFAGTTNIDVPHYAAATLTFAAADDSITDAAAGLVTFLNGDTIRVIGSTANDGVYTIAAGTGATAGHFHVNEALADEAAGAYVTICKRSSPSNNVVIDNITGLMWKRAHTGTTGAVEKVGATSDGHLQWIAAASNFILHPLAADLQMMTTGIKVVGGAAELPRYFAGQILICAGFANAVNNLPGYRVTSVAVNGADLDIFLWRGNNTLIAEAAGGNRSISIICRSVFGYAAWANQVVYAGFSNWRIPNDIELLSIRNMEPANAGPNAVAFPNWPTGAGANSMIWTSTICPSDTTRDMAISYEDGNDGKNNKTIAYFCELVR